MRPLLIIIASLLIAGCAGGSRPTSEFNYLLTSERPAGQASLSGTVYAAPLTVDEPFGQRGFVYREAAQRFVVDPYRGYLSAPGRLIDRRLAAWLTAAGATPTLDRQAARHVVTGRVAALYFDLRPEQPATAVIELRLDLGSPGEAGRALVITGRARVAPVSSDGLAAASNAALADALSQLETALAGESRAALR
ncbi:hypothetical protein [Jeongeupia sp. USM3]|uniref:hypothetical protein n=1 Tax=Jeongeupia sp. USM3 TaxID=1906741 RepID=UPI00089DE943|nr:hypothetical protein [Jeongeupia sp. USM3]AOY01702.1 hypothetical protein BJP62_15285 [Jeongeupia sp. USM3]